jgi:S1-C subfamily serine protease
LPAVVSIEVIGVAEVATGRQQKSEVEQDAPTCGVVIDPAGYIVASDIILRRPSASLLVVLPDQTRLTAKVVARDYHRGLVMLKVSPEQPLPAVSLPDERDTPIGATVVAVGRYGGDLSPIVSTGILSASGRLEGTMLQTDARVSPAFYGGALIDLYGNPLGILVPAVAEGGAPDETSWYDSGVAFAVPTDVLKRKVDRLRGGEDIRKGLIGIVPKTKDPYARGTELAAVRNRSPAEKAGIKPGDVVQSVAGTPVKMFQQVRQILGQYDAGETLPLTLLRDGTQLSVEVELADSIPPLQPQRLGIWAVEQAAEDSSAEAQDADEPAVDVVVRGVVPGTAADGTLQAGDLIEKVDATTIDDLATLQRLLVTTVPDQALKLSVVRDEENVEVEVMPRPVAAPILTDTIEAWSDQAPENPWDVQPLRLPDVTNQAAYVAPKPAEIDADAGLAMLVLLLPPDKRDPEAIIKTYREVAGRFGVVICAIASKEEKRWQPSEIDVVSRMATMLAQRVPVSVSAVAATGVLKDVDASAADSMVIAIALSDRKNFAGIAVAADAKPPAVRLRENEPDQSLEILMPISDLEDGPTWLAPLTKAGYPIALGGEVELDDLLRWTRLLQTL